MSLRSARGPPGRWRTAYRGAHDHVHTPCPRTPPIAQCGPEDAKGSPQWPRRRTRSECSAGTPATSRWCSARTSHRAPGDHRHLLDRARARPRRHEVLSVRDEDAALADVLELSRGMAYKAALAGLDLGGGKAVIIGDPADRQVRGPAARLRALRPSLGGRYITACDVGTYVADMDIVARECDYVTGRSPAARRRRRLERPDRVRRLPGHARLRPSTLWGAPSLLAGGSASPASARSATSSSSHLIDDGADVVVTDVYEPAVDRVRAAHPRRRGRRRRRARAQPTSTSTRRAPSAVPSTTTPSPR